MTLNDPDDCRADYPLQPRDPFCLVPLSPIQLFVWNTRQRRNDLTEVRWSTTAFRILGSLNVEYLRDSIERVTHRHESLRTRFVLVDREPAQHIDPPRPLQLETVDLTHLEHASAQAAAYEAATSLLNLPVHLSVGPLFEAKLLKVSTHEHILILAISHMVTDGGSIRILVEEIWRLYWAAIYDQPLSLPPLPLQYADYAIWQRRNADAWRARHEAYWHERLHGAPRLLKAAPHPDGDSSQWMTWSFDPTLRNRLYDLSRQRGTLLSMTMLTVYIATLSHWCSQSDLVLMIISHGRYRHELQGMVGWIATPLYFRVHVEASDTFSSLLDKASREFRASSAHHDHGQMLSLVPASPTSFMFNWKREPFHVCPTDPRGNLIVQPYSIDRRVRTGTFLPWFYDNRTSIEVTVNFDPNVFKPDTVREFCEGMRTVAEGFVHDPEERLRALPKDSARLFATEQ